MKQGVRKIVTLGPESTGKSILSEQLARHYNTLWCPEFAREYLTKNGTNYTFEDLLNIAKGQIQLEEEYTARLNGQSLLFIDTDMHVMQVWSEFVFGKCHQYILDQIANRKYDLFLLCKPDLPWANDPLREYPDEARRIELFHYYKDMMTNQDQPWAEVSGVGQERLQKAIQAVEQLMKN